MNPEEIARIRLDALIRACMDLEGYFKPEEATQRAEVYLQFLLAGHPSPAPKLKAA